MTDGKSCRSCGSNELDVIEKNISIITPDPYPLNGDMAICICHQCGFVGSQTKAVEKDYQQYYLNYNKHHVRSGELGELDEKYFDELVDFILTKTDFLIDGKSVLDYGSGALQFSKIVSRRGAAHADNYDLGSELTAMKEYDLVVSTHCFEHIYNFNTAFSEIVQLMSSEGLFCLAVPDVRGYSDLYYGPYNCFDLEHINHFELNSLEYVLRNVGLDIIAFRESERRVTTTLSYPEVLVLCRKSDAKPLTSMLSSTRNSVSAVLEDYLQRSEQDLINSVDVMREKISFYGEDSVFGIYGLSSSAFRMLNFINKETHLSNVLTWFADSDERLSGKTLLEKIILSKGLFRQLVEKTKSQGKNIVVFVIAVNSNRIAEYLTEEFGDLIRIEVLPPDSQNRRLV
jgi:hypothetical protein